MQKLARNIMFLSTFARGDLIFARRRFHAFRMAYLPWRYA